MLPDLLCRVTRPDEDIASGSRISSNIPTIGHIATAIDQYRTVAVESPNIGVTNTCFVDISVPEAFSHFLDGSVRSYADLEASEVALQALLLHDSANILVPTVKVERAPHALAQNPNFFRGYRRPDANIRSASCFEVFNALETRDVLYANDFYTCYGDVVGGSARQGASVAGTSIHALDAIFPDWRAESGRISLALGSDLGAPAYIAGPLSRSDQRSGYFGELYHRIDLSWREHTSRIPKLDVSVHLPPFLAIVLDRAGNREEIPDAIRTLRAELQFVRYELSEFNALLRHDDVNQAAAERRAQSILAAFDAIVPASRLDRGWRPLAAVWSLVKPLRTAYSAVSEPWLLDVDQLEVMLREANEAVVRNSSIVDETLTSRTFSDLLRTDQLRHLIGRHFGEDEMRRLSASV
jgi:hypothetical protein